MTLLNEIWQRQLLINRRRQDLSSDFAIDSFTCLKTDEHLIMSREAQFDIPPFACQFSRVRNSSHLLAVADEDGCIQLLNTKKCGSTSVVKDWPAHSNAIFDIDWMHNEPKLLTASGDQTTILWDINRDGALAFFKGHSCSVKSVSFRNEDMFVFATGARDGNIMVWDLRCNRRDGFYQPVNIMKNAHTQQALMTLQRNKRRGRRPSEPQPSSDSQQSVTAVVFQGEHMLISCGAVDGNIKIWDLRKTYTNSRLNPIPCHVFPYPGTGKRKHGFTSLVLDSNQACLFASCTNDRIYMYSCTSLSTKPICSYTGHLNSTFYVKAALSPDDQYILSGSSTNDAHIWKVDNPEAAPVLLKGHLGEVTSVAWCPADQGKIVTCSDDNNLRIWRMIRLPRNTSDSFDEKIAGHCVRSLGALQSLSTKVPESPGLEQTPPSSPLIQRSVNKTTTRLCTNPRLNQPASPVTLTTSIKSPRLNIPLSPNTSSPLLPLNMNTVSQLKKVEGSFAPFPVYNYESKPTISRESSPSHCLKMEAMKCKSPQQLLKTWLKSNPKKRTLEQEASNIGSLIKAESKSKNIKECVNCKYSNEALLTKDSSRENSADTSEHSFVSIKTKCHGCIEMSKENLCEDYSRYVCKNSPQSPHRKRLRVISLNNEADYESKEDVVDNKRQILVSVQRDNTKIHEVLGTSHCSVCCIVSGGKHFEPKEMTTKGFIHDNWLTKHGKYMADKYGIKESVSLGEPPNSSSAQQSFQNSLKQSVSKPSCRTILAYFKPNVSIMINDKPHQ